MCHATWFLDSDERGQEVAHAVAGAVVGRGAAEIGNGVLGRAAVIDGGALPNGAAEVARGIAEIARDIAALVDAGLITLEHDEDGELRARPTAPEASSDGAPTLFGPYETG